MNSRTERSSNNKAAWFLYLIRCADGSLYTGITTDVSRRFGEHQKSVGSGARYLRGRGPLDLVLEVQMESHSQALSVESKVKKLSKVHKEELLASRDRLEALINQPGRE